MHQQLERSLGVLVFENVAHDLVGLARVHHQGQSGSPGGFDVNAEHLGLDVARAKVVVEIQPRLADADHLLTSGEIA